MNRWDAVRMGMLSTALAVGTAAGAEQRRPRVFVPDSDSWSFGGGFALDIEGGLGHAQGGAKPQTAEIIKTVHERCSEAIVTMKEERADYILLLQHEGGKVFVRKDNKYVLFNAEGDALASGSTRSLGNAIKDACKVLRHDWRYVIQAARDAEERRRATR